MKLTISQSLINEMLRPQGYCGYYLNEVYNNQFSPPPSDAMADGLYFEQGVIGSTRDHELIELPKLKNGDKSKREKDLDELIKWAVSVLEKNQIKVKSIQPFVELENRHGHIDFIGTYKGRKTIFDLKYTGMTFKSWDKEVKYGDTIDRFIIQSKHYQSLFAEKMPFMFVIFGDRWARFIKLEYDEQAIEHHKEVATEALNTFNSMNYRPTNDSKLCFDCRMRFICKFVNDTIAVEDFETLMQ